MRGDFEDLRRHSLPGATDDLRRSVDTVENGTAGEWARETMRAGQPFFTQGLNVQQ
jgi:hypothetical protein